MADLADGFDGFSHIRRHTRARMNVHKGSTRQTRQSRTRSPKKPLWPCGLRPFRTPMDSFFSSSRIENLFIVPAYSPVRSAHCFQETKRADELSQPCGSPSQASSI